MRDTDMYGVCGGGVILRDSEVFMEVVRHVLSPGKYSKMFRVNVSLMQGCGMSP